MSDGEDSPAVHETWAPIPWSERFPKKRMATHSIVFFLGGIPWTKSLIDFIALGVSGMGHL